MTWYHRFVSVLDRVVLIRVSLLQSYVVPYGRVGSLLWTDYPSKESSWNVMAHGDAREGKWRGNWWMEWVASTLHTTSEHGVPSVTTTDVHTLAASSRLNWRPRRFKWTRPFRQKTKSGFCVCAITFQMQSTTKYVKHQWVKSMLGT